MFLSIVFPALDEEKKIEKDILRASEFLKSNDLDGEIIIVDDGSSDDTYRLAHELQNSLSANIVILQHENNLGKGFAVRTGIMHAKGEYILYSDLGNIVPLRFVLHGIELLKTNNADMAHGSRKLRESVILKEQDSDRKIASWIFNKLFLRFLKIPSHLTDTQCGFKVYKNQTAKELYSELKIGGFLFELEIILKAAGLGYKIIEFPLEWTCDRDSRISFFSTAPEVLREFIFLTRIKN
jgi:dolichyl-phosphate beta-glucosyltransferase